MVETVAHNGAWPCYIRPVVFRGYGDAGVNPLNCPVEVYICNYPWGKYLSGDGDGVDVCVSSWTRLAPNTLPAMAKAGANYMNSQLIKMEAIANGYVEGIALDANGFVSEGSGENLFLVHRDKLITAPLGNSVLPGITRDSVLQIARDLNIPIVEQIDSARDALHRRRSVLHRHRGRGHADPLGRQDQGRQRRQWARSPRRFRRSSTPSCAARRATATAGSRRFRCAPSSRSAYNLRRQFELTGRGVSERPRPFGYL